MYKTARVRRLITWAIDTLHLRSMSDGPCGDCNWQPSIAQFHKLEYVGIDLVPQLILDNARKYRHAENMRFINLDLVLDDLPRSDIFMVNTSFYSCLV